MINTEQEAVTRPTPVKAIDPADLDFLTEIEEFMEDTGMSASMFGTRCCKDPRFVFALKEGRSPLLKTAMRVRAWMVKERNRIKKEKAAKAAA